ncbi:MAG: hypothetical protein ACI4ES_07615 [Roseburia sp.]
MKKYKKLIVFILVGMIFFGGISQSTNVYAWSNEETQDFAYTTNFESMTDEELNIYIHSIATMNIESTQNLPSANPQAAIANSPLKTAWLAAAELAKRNGYECAGTLVQYSVNGKNYSETNGIFSKKIKTSNAYTKWKKNTSVTSIEFAHNDISDLYYALHLANIFLYGNSTGANAVVRDTFDFAYTSDMGSLFSTFVNDWGWLSQQTGALTPISVTIYISQ